MASSRRKTTPPAKMAGAVQGREACFACDGKGRQSVSVTTIGKDGTSEAVAEISCIQCNGRKDLPAGSKKKHEADMKAIAALWCSCGRSDEAPAIFHDDGTCRKCYKHHWHCGRCGKIVQVG